MWIAVALCAILFWLAIFFTFFQADEEALRARLPESGGKPPPVGTWTRCFEHPDGDYEEERYLASGRRWIRQVRRRSSDGTIIEVLEDAPVSSRNHPEGRR